MGLIKGKQHEENPYLIKLKTNFKDKIKFKQNEISTGCIQNASAL